MGGAVGQAETPRHLSGKGMGKLKKGRRKGKEEEGVGKKKVLGKRKENEKEYGNGKRRL